MEWQIETSKSKRIAMLIVLALLCVLGIMTHIVRKSFDNTEITTEMIEKSKELEKFKEDIHHNELAIDTATHSKKRNNNHNQTYKSTGAPIDMEVADISE